MTASTESPVLGPARRLSEVVTVAEPVALPETEPLPESLDEPPPVVR